MKRKKILYFHHTASNGGATMSLFYLIDLARRDYDIVVYFLKDGPAVDFYENAGIRCVVNNSLGKFPHCTIENQCLNPFNRKFYLDFRIYLSHYWNFIFSIHVARQIIQHEKPLIVHLNSSVLITQGVAAKSICVPVVWHMRDFLEKGTFGVRRLALRHLICWASDIVIGLCESEIRRVGCKKKAVVVPNFVDLKEFDYNIVSTSNLREHLGCSLDTRIIAMLGWHNPSKGAEVLLQAFAKLADEHSDAILVFFGEGASAQKHSTAKRLINRLCANIGIPYRIRQMINLLGLQKKVFIHEAVFDISKYIADVDIVAVPFTKPHFARPILEAGAMKKIVVASDIDGVREMVLNGAAGYLAKPNDPLDWKIKLETVLREDNNVLIDNMYRNTLKNYNRDINAERTISIYRQLERKRGEI